MKKVKIFGMLVVVILLFSVSNSLSIDANKSEGGETLWIYDSDLYVKNLLSADLTGDGINDVIAAEFDSDNYDDPSTVYGINGLNGSTIWTYQANDGIRTIALGDINDDGVMDVVAGASKGTTTPDGKVHAIDGTDGSLLWDFLPAGSGDTIGDVAIGDFNGDSYLDVAIACWDDYVYAIDGLTGDQLWQSYIGSIFVTGVDTGDVNDDGIDDVAFSNSYLTGYDNYQGVLNGINGENIWIQTVEYSVENVILSDIDADNKLEAIFGVHTAADEAEFYVRDAETGSLEWSYNLGPDIGLNPDIFFFSNDIDQDGDLDLIVGNEYVDFHIYAFDGDSATPMWISEELAGYARDISFADITGDGYKNIITSTYDRVQILNASDGTKQWYVSVAGTVMGTTVGDFDDDGIDDFACSGGAEFSGDDPAKSVWAIKTTQFSPVLWEFDVEEYGNALAIGDVNGNSISDVIGVTSNDKAWAIDGVTGDEIWNWTGSNNLYTVTAGDFDGDGFDDAAVAGADDKVTALNGSDGSILWEFTLATDQFYRKCLKAEDLNQDGKIDVIAGCDDSNVYAINGEDGTLIWSVDLQESVRDVRLCNIDGDDVMDVVAAGSNEIAIINGSDGSILWNHTNGVSGAKHAIALDVNDDGIKDVAWASYSKIVLIDGETHSELWSIITTVNSDYCLDSGYINEDTIPDIIYGGGVSNDHNVIALHGNNGSVIWDFPTGGEVNCVLVSNVDDDDDLEVIAGSDDQYVYVINHDGTEQWSYSTADDVMHVGIGDLTGDSKVDIAAITFGFDGLVYAFNSLQTLEVLTADFSFTPNNPTINDTIQFYDESVTDENEIVSWFWDFGDGNTSDNQHPTHNYSSTGNYNVCLTVTNEDNEVDSICKDVYVSSGIEGFLDVSQDIYDRPFLVRHASDGDWGGAQNFVPTVNTMTKVELYMKVLGTPSFDLTVELREDSIDGALMDTITMNPIDFSSDWEWIEFDFDDVGVVAGTEYFVVLNPPPSGVTNTFGYGWGYSLGDTIDDSSLWFTRTSGSFWLDLPDLYDYTFRTYGY